MKSSNQGSSSGQTTYVPQINPFQIAENAAGSGVYQVGAGATGNAITGGQSLFNQSLPGVTYAGQNVAGYGSQMQNVLGTGGEQNFNVGSQGLQNLFSPDYEQRQINASMIPAQQQYMQNMANQNAGFGGAGQLGSARAALAANQLAMTNQQNQQMAAANTANQVAQQRAAAANQLMSGGQQALTGGLQGAQAGLAASQVPMQMWQQYAPVISQLMQGAKGNFAGTGGYTQTNNAGNTSGGINILPGLSDVTAKENIEFVGFKGEHRLYDFNYRGKPERYRGVMAQEVQSYMPEAVIVGEDGLLRVKYDMLGFDMIELGK
jgi:hypothetical protein